MPTATRRRLKWKYSPEEADDFFRQCAEASRAGELTEGVHYAVTFGRIQLDVYRCAKKFFGARWRAHGLVLFSSARALMSRRGAYVIAIDERPRLAGKRPRCVELDLTNTNFRFASALATDDKSPVDAFFARCAEASHAGELVEGQHYAIVDGLVHLAVKQAAEALGAPWAERSGELARSAASRAYVRVRAAKHLFRAKLGTSRPWAVALSSELAEAKGLDLAFKCESPKAWGRHRSVSGSSAHQDPSVFP